ITASAVAWAPSCTAARRRVTSTWAVRGEVTHSRTSRVERSIACSGEGKAAISRGTLNAGANARWYLPRPHGGEPMRVLLQRVSSGSVTIAGSVVGSIETGFVLLVGFAPTDTAAEVEWMADKVVGLRLFPDDEGKMNRDLAEAGGGLLVISQFTLYGD